MRRICLFFFVGGLSACSPIVDLELHNNAGQQITVEIPGGGRTSIAPNTAAIIDLVVPQGGFARQFAIVMRNTSYSYPGYMRAFADVPFSLREHRSFESQRIHAKVDSHGRILLSSPKRSDIVLPTQPAGFPIEPAKA
jgi:hypothetical protein